MDFPKGMGKTETDDSGLLPRSWRWLHHDSAEIEKIRKYLTCSGFVIIVRATLEVRIFRGISLTW